MSSLPPVYITSLDHALKIHQAVRTIQKTEMAIQLGVDIPNDMRIQLANASNALIREARDFAPQIPNSEAHTKFLAAVDAAQKVVEVFAQFFI